MSDKDKKIDQLLEKLEALSKRQAFFTAEIHLLKEELEILKTTKTETSFVETSPVESPVFVEKSESFSEKQLVKEPTIVPEKTSHKPQFKPRKDSGFKKKVYD